MTDQRRARILIHPGFHKTGTSSIQHLLWSNRACLAPHLGLLLLRHLRPAARICMAYSRDLNPLRLADMVEAMDGILADNGMAPDQIGGRDLLLSCEGLSGHLPGWPSVDTYAAAPVTIAFMTGYFRERFPTADVQVVLTTRQQDDWLYSAWRHHLMGQRLRLDWPAFERAYRPAADMVSVLRDINAAIAPVPMFTLGLEDARSHPLGPGGALLERIDLPRATRDALRPVGHDNPGPDGDVSAAFLELNRSTVPDAVVRTRKEELAEAARVGGWVTGARRRA